MEYATQIIVALIALTGPLAVGYWQWVRKPKKEPAPSMGDRALDQLMAEAVRLRRDITSERRSHDVTREQYIDVVQRLATVEAQLEAARNDLAERDALIRELRSELDSVRRDVDEMRGRHGR